MMYADVHAAVCHSVMLKLHLSLHAVACIVIYLFVLVHQASANRLFATHQASRACFVGTRSLISVPLYVHPWPACMF